MTTKAQLDSTPRLLDHGECALLLCHNYIKSFFAKPLASTKIIRHVLYRCATTTASIESTEFINLMGGEGVIK